MSDNQPSRPGSQTPPDGTGDAATRPAVLWAFLVSVRPWEWTKNLFVFTGLLFAYRFCDVSAIGHAAHAFVAFCGLSGIAYVINDWHDREQDQKHPHKCRRPIARGHLSGAAAVAGIAVTMLCVVAVGAPLGWSFAAWGLGYFALNVAYSLWLKRVIFLDLFCLAAGFLIRLYAGCAAADVPVSSYAVGCTASLALMLGAGKRRAELLAHGGDSARHRSVFDSYTPRLLDATLGVAVIATLVSYSLFVMSRKHPQAMVGTVVLVAFGVHRYLRLLYGGRGADQPARLVWKDRLLLMTCICWGVVSLAILTLCGHPKPR